MKYRPMVSACAPQAISASEFANTCDITPGNEVLLPLANTARPLARMN